MASRIISFTLNGREVEVMVKPLTTLQTVLREQFSYTAAKNGCRQGGCGSCTVLVNGEPMTSCLLPIEDIAGQAVTTLEGLTPMEGLHPLQAAFLDNYATQCGYCAPGMIMVAKALLDRNPNPTREQIVEALAGNYCRCTGYAPIIKAVEEAAATPLIPPSTSSGRGPAAGGAVPTVGTQAGSTTQGLKGDQNGR